MKTIYDNVVRFSLLSTPIRNQTGGSQILVDRESVYHGLNGEKTVTHTAAVGSMGRGICTLLNQSIIVAPRTLYRQIKKSQT